jgi:prevent-host-death family protein
MTRQYSIAEAKDHLSRILHDVEKGKPVELTRRGEPIAVLVSYQQFNRAHKHKRGFWEALMELRREMERNGGFLEEGDFKDLRDKSPGRDVKL